MNANPGDVIRTEDRIPYITKTFTVEQLQKVVYGQISVPDVEKAIEEGLCCEYLSVDGGGWRKARYRITIEIEEE